MLHTNHNIDTEKITTQVETFSSLIYEVSFETLHQRTRVEEIVSARFLAFYLLYRIHKWSTPRIARHFKMNPSSIGHGIHEMEQDSNLESIKNDYLSTYPQH